jgi:hyperosmotically inducible periplasmic protein
MVGKEQWMSRAKFVTGVAAVILAIATAGAARGQDAAADEVTGKVRKALARLPYYGVFDFLAYKVDKGVVTLHGYAHRPALQHEAEDAVRRATSYDVVNAIELLPTSSLDDRIRWEAYRRVYTDDFSDRYVSGGSREVGYALFDMSRFPGMQPYGNYPVHIVVKHRHVTLIGSVATTLDKNALGVRARQVTNTSGLEDLIMVRTRG